MIVNKKLPEKYRSSVANLLLNALGDKFCPILGKGNKAKQLLELSVNLDNCLSVTNETELLGFLAFQINETGFINPSFRTLINVYGLFNGITKGIGLSFLRHKIIPGEIHIEAIAVDEFSRNKGIGFFLLNAIFLMSKVRGYKIITLEVIDTNSRAKELYEKMGFKVIKKNTIWPVNKWIGWAFSDVYLLKKNVS